MKGKWLGFAVLACVATALLNLVSCGRTQELVAINIQPTTETFGATNIPVSADAGLFVQLTALGTYVHPPVTKDITSQVTWFSSDPQMFTVSSTGTLTATGGVCGTTLVSATASTNHDTEGLSAPGAIITGSMTANVVCYDGSGTGSGPAITVTFGNTTGTGTVTFNPSGITCTSPNACLEQFADGTAVSLTATPTGSSQTATWENCPVTTTTNVCSFTLETDTTVTATFN